MNENTQNYFSPHLLISTVYYLTSTTHSKFLSHSTTIKPQMVGEGSLPDGLSWTFILKDSESSVVMPMTYCHSILWLLFWVIDTLGGTPKKSPGFQTDLFSHTVEQPDFPLTSVNKGNSFSAYWFSGIKSMVGIWLPIRWTHYCVPWEKNWRLRPPKQHRSVLLGKEQKFCKWVLDISEQLPLLSLDSQDPWILLQGS